MAEVALTDKNFSGSPFSDREYITHVVYDFANDAGATANWLNLDAFTGTVAVEVLYVYTETTVVGATATIDLGKGNGGTEFLSAKAITALTAGSLVEVDTPGTRIIFTSSDALALSIDTAAITAGKFHIVYKVMWVPA